jgi:hypothetical protein
MFKFLLTTLTVAAVSTGSANAEISKVRISENKVDVIPYDMYVDRLEGNISVEPATVTIRAKKGTDLFTNTTGDKSVDKSPRVLFEPKGDFIFSAKVSTEFNSAYDGGALLVYANTQQWAKLLFERFKSGKNGIATTVSTIKGDDAYHGTRAASSLYLKIARHDTSYVFYTSNDGQEWNFERHFSLDTNASVKVGFTAQSPLSETQRVIFTDIQYKGERFKNYWQGK